MLEFFPEKLIGSDLFGSGFSDDGNFPGCIHDIPPGIGLRAGCKPCSISVHWIPSKETNLDSRNLCHTERDITNVCSMRFAPIRSKYSSRSA